ncbi:MAG: polyamine aminopropyltransferase [Luteolibacter sp.]
MESRGMRLLLLASVFTIATCGLIYELIAGTLASYLLGDSVTQFSTVIGVYLFAMGVGSWISKFVKTGVLATFIRVEFMIGLIGGFSAFVLFALFDQVASFRVLLYAMVFVIGCLVGLEIPLLLRLLKDQLKFEDLVSRVLSLDYIGALAASLLFPLVLVPKLGLVRSSFLFGMLNAAVGLLALWFLRDQLRRHRGLWVGGVISLLLLLTGFIGADRLQAWAERAAYNENVIFAHSSPYQRLVLTRHNDDLRLYLNGNLQFSSRDEYRYHEALVHPALVRSRVPENVLVLGGGDGLAAREILRHPSVKSITLVDLDAEMTNLFAKHPLLTPLNQGSLNSPKLHVENADAFSWLESAVERSLRFDAVIIDFPDPSNFSIGKLYSTAFYEKLRRVLHPDAVITIQCTSPLAARKSFWCIDETLHSVGYGTLPYHVYVPSFGEWGFILACPDPAFLSGVAPRPLPGGLRYLTDETQQSAFRFPPDMSVVAAGVNRLNNQILVRYFEEEWRRYE